MCVERSDGTDMFELLVEFGEPIPDIDDENRIEREFFAAPSGGALH